MAASSHHGTSSRIAGACALALACSASGQTLFSEDFENMGFVPIGGWGPAGLINEGWTFVNNSQPLGTTGYFTGCCWGSVIPALSGTGYLAASADSAAGGGPQYSTWAVLPAVAGQAAGDMFSFYTISSDTSPWEDVSLQVRYSPTGGANVGTGASSVGDFTEVILDIPVMPNYNSGLANGWTYWEVPIPGAGRIALRQYGTTSLYFGIEDLAIFTPGPPTGPYPQDFESLGGICGEGPCALLDDGWIFVDQSVPTWQEAWEPNQALDSLEPYEGFGFMKSQSAAGGGFESGGVNNWAILPSEGLGAGDELSFFATGSPGTGGVLEVRYSPTGGTSTGSGLNGVGSFTQVLVGLDSLSPGAWQPVSAVIPGDGRVAIRFHNPSIPSFSGAKTVAVDSMAVNVTPPGPPLPQPGETVTWTVAMSPIAIGSAIAIPAGATLFVDPGVVINIATGSSITVAGEFYALGTAGRPITINGYAPMFPAFLAGPGGHSEFTLVSMNDGRFEPTFATDCTASGSVVDARKVVGCSFSSAGVSVMDDNLAIEDSTFSGGGINLLRGYLHIDNVSIDNGVIDVNRQHASQTVYLDNLSVTGTPSAPGLRLGGWSFFLGADNELAGNLYPVELSGGLAPGSTVPPTGNLSNFVHLINNDSPTGYDELPPIPVPYLMTDSYLPGLGLDVLPGAAFVGTSGSQFWEQFDTMRLLGLPGQPITFQGQSSGPGSWHGLEWSLSEGSKAEYCVVTGATFGMLVDDSVVAIDNCTFESNVHGVRAANSSLAILRKNQFTGNLTGVSATPVGSFDLNGQTNPNSIAGNGQGAVEEDPFDSPDARHNWWGDPSGPTTPDNPGGQGDTATANINVIPFRTAPPDFLDTPPVVRLQETARLFETNAKLILHWDASDDGAIVSQRVLFSELGIPGSSVVLLDDLPAAQRSALVTVPESIFFHRGYFIVEAVDDAGQVGHDRRWAPVAPDPATLPGSYTFPPGFEGPFVTGQEIIADLPYVAGNTYEILLDDMNESIDLGAASSVRAPWTSTDSARVVAISISGKRFFTGYFPVRPPEYFGDAAPSVELLSPRGGGFPGGSTVNVTWASSDDEAVRGFDLLASYDGARTWHYVRKGIPAEATSYAWKLPPLDETLADVHLRLVAWDQRFQSSSAVIGPISLSPGDSVPGDLNGDGAVNVLDLLGLLGAWGPCAPPCAADLDGDGDVGVTDLLVLLANWG